MPPPPRTAGPRGRRAESVTLPIAGLSARSSPAEKGLFPDANHASFDCPRSCSGPPHWPNGTRLLFLHTIPSNTAEYLPSRVLGAG
ncbi:hypothetical protein BO71DRAFT_402630 [Aspergillus ellipticus CBS 707.79]|uniref:Uncharacterized protein n=1 Tax=Aspergillus ellipticus CBS 707.79 TaxID=1448320 RepID=A0A319CYX4_9EURO|nr:hypothetical protein BO71DRAFT_402630 [Aspergillus ellipticus CBS 707.79]